MCSLYNIAPLVENPHVPQNLVTLYLCFCIPLESRVVNRVEAVDLLAARIMNKKVDIYCTRRFPTKLIPKSDLKQSIVYVLYKK